MQQISSISDKDFLEDYKNLEDKIIEKLNLDREDEGIRPFESLCKIPEYSKYEQKLRKIKVLRNIIAHHPGISSNDFFSISPKAYEFLKEITKHIENPPSILTKMTQRANLLCGEMNSFAIEIMLMMRERNYSYVPVVNSDKKVIGVFSETSVFNYSTDNLLYMIENEDTLDKFTDYIDMEKFSDDRFAFISRNCTIIDAYRTITAVSSDAKRISALFVTENGKKTETLLGMLTLWDVIS